MKKAQTLLLLLFVFVAVSVLWRYRGYLAIVAPPNVDVVNVIEKHNTKVGTLSEPINDTSFPFTIPIGTRISIYAKDLKSPRDLEADGKGNIIVSAMGEGKVYVIDGNTQKAVLSNLNKPHGLSFNCVHDKCQLYVAEADKVVVYDWDQKNKLATNSQKIISLPTGGRHTTRSLLIHDSKLYISIGSSCDTCVEGDTRRATIMSANLDGSNFNVHATGLRNSVFMALNPTTNEIWATEMGRDFLGDDLPPEEVNIIHKGEFYGWPYCFGKQTEDKTFSSKNGICNTSVTPRVMLPAHTAPLGLAFYKDDLLVAMHGSWNSSVPVGYKIVKVNVKTGEIEDFVTGWLSDGRVLGRPVDILVSGEKIYISDDKAGVVYQLENL